MSQLLAGASYRLQMLFADRGLSESFLHANFLTVDIWLGTSVVSHN